MSHRSNARSWIQRWEGQKLAKTGIWAVRRRLAEAMRLVIERLTTTDAPEAELQIAAERLEQYAEHLGKHPRHRRYEGYAESATAGGAPEGGGHFDWSPLIGRANPLAPPIVMRSDEEGRVHGRVLFGTAYEGPPGCVHGGFVAAAFDEVLGFVQSLGGNPGFTGTLTIKYRSPTPLHTELRFTGELARQEGRKTFCTAQLHAGEQLCAEAEGLFVAAKPGKLDALREKREALEAKLTGESE